MKDKIYSIIGLGVIFLIIWGNIMFFKILFSDKEDNSKNNSSSNYSYEHKCEYFGCTNYASKTKYCSQHTTYKKCAINGCSNSVSYSSATYCAKHELELYSN